MMRRYVVALLAAALPFVVTSTAQAQENFPNRPIRIIVPLAAGGGLDGLARVLAEKMSAKLGQPVVVENRTGAAGNIGSEVVFRAAPDGYTLLFTQPGPLTVNQWLYKDLPFQPEKFVPISLISLQDILLAANPKVPFKTVQELISYAKANPGKLNFGSSGAGSAPHLSAEMFKSAAKVDITHVPYNGAAESMRATLAGEVDLTFFAFGTALANARAGKLHPVGIGGEKRNPQLADVPTIAEVLPDYRAFSFTAMVAPPGTPPDVVKKLQQTMVEVRNDPDIRARLIGNGDQIFDIGPEKFSAFLEEDRKRWGDLIKSIGITLN